MNNIKNTIQPDNKKQQLKNNWHWVQVTFVIIIKIILSIYAGFLAWRCNKNEHVFVKTLLIILAVLFSEIYIIYYALYRVFMGNKCSIKST